MGALVSHRCLSLSLSLPLSLPFPPPPIYWLPRRPSQKQRKPQAFPPPWIENCKGQQQTGSYKTQEDCFTKKCAAWAKPLNIYIYILNYNRWPQYVQCAHPRRSRGRTGKPKACGICPATPNLINLIYWDYNPRPQYVQCAHPRLRHGCTGKP